MSIYCSADFFRDAKDGIWKWGSLIDAGHIIMTWSAEFSPNERIQSRIGRALGRMKRFRYLSSEEAIEIIRAYPRASAECGEPVGRFRSDGEREATPKLYFTEEGVWWRTSSGVRIVRYIDIASVTAGPEQKETERILITLKSGEVCEMPIRGREGHIYDAMGMLRFLMRAAHDVR